MRYKVLWIDDAYKEQLPFIGEAEQEDIDITPFESHEEGIEHLNSLLDVYHAVILDAKVKKGKNDTATGLAGLRASRDRLVEINNNGYLPYFIFTGQPDYVSSDMFSQSYGSYYIKATDNERLFKDLKEAILKKDEYQIQKRYQRVFEICTEQYIGTSAQKPLLKILKSLNEPTDSFDDELYFTQIRIILESMFRQANKLGFLHDNCIVKGKVNLTESGLFMSGEATKHLNVRCKKSHFTKIISDNVKSILFITGAASHTVDAEIKNNINLVEYRTSVNTPYLLYSLTFQLMDVLIWFKQYADQNPDKEGNKLYWETLSTNIREGEWIKGTITRIADNGYGTFQPMDGGKSISIIPVKVKEHHLVLHQTIEVVTKIDNTGTKTQIDNIRIVQ